MTNADQIFAILLSEENVWYACITPKKHFIEEGYFDDGNTWEPPDEWTMRDEYSIEHDNEHLTPEEIYDNLTQHGCVWSEYLTNFIEQDGIEPNIAIFRPTL